MDVRLSGKNKEIQVIIITTQCFAPKIGGIESLMTGMAEAMAKRGIEVLVLADGQTHETDNKKKYKIKSCASLGFIPSSVYCRVNKAFR